MSARGNHDLHRRLVAGDGGNAYLGDAAGDEGLDAGGEMCT